jgi:hypothetical protein
MRVTPGLSMETKKYFLLFLDYLCFSNLFLYSSLEEDCVDTCELGKSFCV